MDPLYDFINSQYQVWDPCMFLDTAAIDVTEIWTDPTSQSRLTRQRRVATSDVDEWLKQTSATIGGAKSSVVLRLVWVKFQHMERIKHISSAVLDRLLSHFGIEVAHRWNWTCFAGSTRFDGPGPESGPLFSYSVCNHPKVAAAWSHSPATGITQGIYFAGASQVPELQDLLLSLSAIASHPMLPALVFGISLSGLIEQEHKRIKENVRAVEVRTRFHSWASRNENPAEGDYISLSSATTGAKTKLANLHRRTIILHELCDFVRENLHPHSKEESLVRSPLVESIVEYTRVLRRRTVLQAADVQFFQHRADAQVAAPAVMIAQDKAAVDTNITSAMQQDSSSLKTLSLVTMFFLPDTFLATLFSVPLLNWKPEEAMEGKFWIYWAFAIPLRLITFGTWWSSR
ncbi:uncharacterized protein P174DRAFT_448201 [Aspergillus novofumigatus IBT 16806]|uniref:Uncharacterized protein n=1 Tax=Aspergillus novofumigatus (strain IBT 16806) TaxID=1392255 RepID=A0A2I1CFK6_ASPN1|nr:uncharacterized protein P174DRAFT_448201 [Aspergillus novofumigatus IBT 16806]PKX96417.1 hypothetical protein P174DRAFT_448201 [Aspergillus novofumigatus IBT 16806]